MDADKSSTICASEVQQVLKLLHIHIDREAANRLVALADVSGDGSLSYPEFVAAFESDSFNDWPQRRYLPPAPKQVHAI